MLYRGMPKKRHTLMFNVILKEMKSLYYVFTNNLFQKFANIFLLDIKEDILKTVLGAQQPYINYDRFVIIWAVILIATVRCTYT